MLHVAITPNMVVCWQYAFPAGEPLTSESIATFCEKFLANELPRAYRSQGGDDVVWQQGTVHNVIPFKLRCRFWLRPVLLQGDMGSASSKNAARATPRHTYKVAQATRNTHDE